MNEGATDRQYLCSYPFRSLHIETPLDGTVTFLQVPFPNSSQISHFIQPWASGIPNANFLTLQLAIICHLFVIQQILDYSLIMCRLPAQLMCY